MMWNFAYAVTNGKCQLKILINALDYRINTMNSIDNRYLSHWLQYFKSHKSQQINRALSCKSNINECIRFVSFCSDCQHLNNTSVFIASKWVAKVLIKLQCFWPNWLAQRCSYSSVAWVAWPGMINHLVHCRHRSHSEWLSCWLFKRLDVCQVTLITTFLCDRSFSTGHWVDILFVSFLIELF